MAMVKGTNANKTSTVPSSKNINRGNSGKSKKLRGTNPASQSVVPATPPLNSDKRGGPMVTPKRGGKGSISSGGGSFGQK